MSPNTNFPPCQRPENAVTERLLEHPRVTYDVDGDALVIALKDELLVRTDARVGSPALDEELTGIACLRGPSRGQAAVASPAGVEVWRITDPKANSIDHARRLRALAPEVCVTTLDGRPLDVPAVSPNHILVVSPKYDTCPASPPNPLPPPHGGDFIPEDDCELSVSVVVIDTGYIETSPPHAALDARVTLVAGVWLDTSVDPPVWRPTAADVADADEDGRLDPIAGHGTFIAGLIAHGCPEARITAVGQRHACMPIGDTSDPVDRAMLFTSEYDVANALLMNADADVVSCGFSFPVLDGYPSIPFTSVMSVLTGPDAPRPGVAVVSPAGNEDSGRPYWPAAHPDVIGVAATNRRGNARAHFSNWGPWADCCARGEDVTSTFLYWVGPLDGEPPSQIDDFVGWARWDGTSFAAPKVSAAIARVVADSGGGLLPIDAFAQLISGAAGVEVTPLTDVSLSGPAGVTLPHLHLG